MTNRSRKGRFLFSRWGPINSSSSSSSCFIEMSFTNNDGFNVWLNKSSKWLLNRIKFAYLLLAILCCLSSKQQQQKLFILSHNDQYNMSEFVCFGILWWQLIWHTLKLFLPFGCCLPQQYYSIPLNCLIWHWTFGVIVSIEFKSIGVCCNGFSIVKWCYWMEKKRQELEQKMKSFLRFKLEALVVCVESL